MILLVPSIYDYLDNLEAILMKKKHDIQYTQSDAGNYLFQILRELWWAAGRGGMRESISDPAAAADVWPRPRDQRPTYRGESPSAGGDQELTWGARGHRGPHRDDHCH